MDCRLDAAAFDTASSAGWYSAIAGLLAGFALLAILLPLDHGRDERAGRNLTRGFLSQGPRMMVGCPPSAR